MGKSDRSMLGEIVLLECILVRKVVGAMDISR